MKIRQFASACILAGLCATTQAAVINAPIPLDDTSSGWPYSGMGFVANRDSTLTHFEFLSPGAGSNVVLADATGTILNSVAIAGGSNAVDVDVSWSLISGQQYYLLGHLGNFSFASFGMAAPANEDITLTATGVFSQSLNPAEFYYGNTYWSTFTDIRTSEAGAVAADVPEPNTLALFGLALAACVAFTGAGTRKV